MAVPGQGKSALLAKLHEQLTSPSHLVIAPFVGAIAAPCIEGESVIHNIGQIDRGFERMDERLQKLGARFERVN